MPRMNGTGPEGKGSGTGRGLGRCKKNLSNEDVTRSGKGSGKHHRSGGGTGKGKRLKSGIK